MSLCSPTVAPGLPEFGPENNGIGKHRPRQAARAITAVVRRQRQAPRNPALDSSQPAA